MKQTVAVNSTDMARFLAANSKPAMKLKLSFSMAAGEDKDGLSIPGLCWQFFEGWASKYLALKDKGKVQIDVLANAHYISYWIEYMVSLLSLFFC